MDPDASGRRDVLRCLTWNLWWRFGDWRRRFAAIRSVLQDVEPDVCGLQEVWADADHNAAALLAEDLGMHLAWVPCPAPGTWQRRLGDPTVGIGNAVLSRWPIGDSASERLPHGTGPDDGRTVLYARVDAPGGPVPFFTTQLTSAPDLSATRCGQVSAVARFVDRHSGAGHPPVLTGDLNAEPDSDEVRLLCGHKTAPAVPGLVLVDAWRYADPPAPGWTWDRANPHVLATGEPSERIDHVLVGLPGADGRGRVRRVGLVGDAPVDGVWPSDHAGVLVELQAGGAGPGNAEQAPRDPGPA
jgi:endonuclease/exonuclease/phosphatase family metal-dependent hydrolase